MGRVGNIGDDINWDASPVSSPATALTHCVKVNTVNKLQCRGGYYNNHAYFQNP